MTNIIGDTGNSYYSAAFEIYNILLIISAYSLPLAVSKLVSARVSKGQRKNAYRIVKGALLLATGTGLTASLILFFLSLIHIYSCSWEKSQHFLLYE